MSRDNRKESPHEELPRAVHAHEDALREAVQEALGTSDKLDFSAIGIEVEANSHVRLIGEVTTQAEKDEAERLASGVEGVYGLENHLIVTPLNPTSDGPHQAKR